MLIDDSRLADFCRCHHIRKLAFFGSILRDDFSSHSDVDVLVEFDEDAAVGLIRLSAIERELSTLLGRKADLNTPGFLNRSFRRRVLAEAEVHFVSE